MPEAHAFDFDFSDEEVTTEVVDVEEPPLWSVTIAMPRVATGDLTVHVLHEGFWHRMHASSTKTACGRPIDWPRSITRQARVMVHPLSKGCGCFTQEEIAEADGHDAKRFEP